MTYEEAKALFKEDLKDGKCSDDCPECNARELAISALEKQIPKKPIWNKNNESRCCCPNCEEELYVENHHCKCGQALDWSDIE